MMIHGAGVWETLHFVTGQWLQRFAERILEEQEHEERSRTWPVDPGGAASGNVDPAVAGPPVVGPPVSYGTMEIG